jgi:hypothetical protein
MERHIVVEVTKKGQLFVMYGKKGKGANVNAKIVVRCINHHHEHRERIIGCRALLKARRLWFWRRTIAEFDVHNDDTGTPITDILLEPMSSPLDLRLDISGAEPDVSLPRWSELVLVFDMVGQMRKVQRQLTRVTHDPKKAKHTAAVD